MININKIIDAICITLNSQFGDGYEIYTQSVEQGLKEPCFFVFCVSPTSEKFLAKRYVKRNLFSIQYFPSTKEVSTECNDVLETLFDCLEYVCVGEDITFGTKMHGEVSDGILNFFVSYDMFVYKKEENEPHMQDLGLKTDVKG